MCETIKNALLEAIAELKAMPLDELVAARRKKIAGFGIYKEV